jgi:RNA polymerase sigma factor (sigma-70 family)
MKVLECPVDETGSVDLELEIKRCEAALLALIRSRMDPMLKACVQPEDILQDALVKAVEYWGEHPPLSASSIHEWLQQKVLDCLLDKHDYFHAKMRDTARAQRLPGGSSDQGGSQLADSNSTPSVKVARQERKDRLLHALSLLKPSYAEILRKHDLEGIGLEEVAQELGLTHENMRQRHGRAFRKLKDLWKKLYGDEDFQL